VSSIRRLLFSCDTAGRRLPDRLRCLDRRGCRANTVSLQPGNYVEHFEFVQSLLKEYDIPPARRWVDIDNIAAGINPTGAAAPLDIAFEHNIKLVADALGALPAELVQRTKQASVIVAALVGQPNASFLKSCTSLSRGRCVSVAADVPRSMAWPWC
jgi:hypothetical protein